MIPHLLDLADQREVTERIRPSAPDTHEDYGRRKTDAEMSKSGYTRWYRYNIAASFLRPDEMAQRALLLSATREPPEGTTGLPDPGRTRLDFRSSRPAG